MNQLRKAVRDYLTMRRGLGFKLVRHEARAAGVRVIPGAKTQFAHHRESGAGVGNATCRITNRMSGRRGSASCAASPGTGVRRIP